MAQEYRAIEDLAYCPCGNLAKVEFKDGEVLCNECLSNFVEAEIYGPDYCEIEVNLGNWSWKN